MQLVVPVDLLVAVPRRRRHGRRAQLGQVVAAAFAAPARGLGPSALGTRALAGVGLRWASPVGPLRLDIARGLDDPDSPFTLHLDIGTAF